MIHQMGAVGNQVKIIMNHETQDLDMLVCTALPCTARIFMFDVKFRQAWMLIIGS